MSKPQCTLEYSALSKQLVLAASKLVKSGTSPELKSDFLNILSAYPDFRAGSNTPTHLAFRILKKECAQSDRYRYLVARALLEVDRALLAHYILGSARPYATAQQHYLHAATANRIGNTHQYRSHLKKCLSADPEYTPALAELLTLAETCGERTSCESLKARLYSARSGRRLTKRDMEGLVVYEPWHQLQRFGGSGDGGYLVMDQEGAYDCFLSGGISGNMQFEIDFCQAHHMKCDAFDPTIDFLPSKSDGVRLHKMAISGTNSARATNLHEYLETHKDVFIKMDVEGAEYNWIDSLTRSHLSSIKQMVVEFHSPLSKRRLACIAALTTTLTLVHIHANNYQQTRDVEGFKLPVIFEATFVRTPASSSLRTNTKALPHPQDEPNVRGRPDIRLDTWPYVTI